MRRLELRLRQRLPGTAPPPEVRGKPKLSESSGLSGSTNVELLVLNVDLSIYPITYRWFTLNS